jgi:RNA polymerase sigma-54 factor
MRLSPEDAAALMVLIESLDGDGYLADPLEEIAERLAEMLGRRRRARDELMDRLRCALKLAAEPGAHRAWARATCRVPAACSCAPRRPSPARDGGDGRICENHLELLARRDMKKLVTAATGADEDLLRAAQA